MATWFTVRIKYQKEQAEGKIAKVTEGYLFDAITYGEVEQRVFAELASLIKQEFSIVNISKTQLSDVFYLENGEKWFKCKVTFVEFDEKTEKEKKVNQNMLIYALTVEDAYLKLSESLRDSGMKYFDIPSISETIIADVFPYEKEEPILPQKKQMVEEADIIEEF
jgi:hypothetical protein